MPASFPFLSPLFLEAFVSALAGTAKVFTMGAVGFIALKRGWIKPEGLVPLGQLVAFVTLPCQIFSRFAMGFNPQTFPGWWKVALLGIGVTFGGLCLGKLLARRHKNEEATLLVGYQNAGFFVLPMLQALLPPEEFLRASVYLFVFIIPFNATLWPVGNRVLLGRKEINMRALITAPTITVLVSLVLYGAFYDQAHWWDGTILHQVLLGTSTPGAITLIGDLTVPLATLILGGSIAATFAAARASGTRLTSRRATIETTFVKLVLYPLLGYWLLTYWPNAMWSADHVLWLLLMLQFAAPPAVNIAVFCQQSGFPMRLIPAVSLLSYICSLLTVPFWVAMVPPKPVPQEVGISQTTPVPHAKDQLPTTP